MARSRTLSRRSFLVLSGAGAALTLLAACSGPPAAPGAPAGQPGATSAPAAGSGTRKSVVFWGRQQFLPESNDYLTESVKLAAQKGGFDVSVQLFTNDEHAQK